MGIALKTQKMLWGKAAALCSFSDCRRHLVEDESEVDDPALVGENAHIVARENDGPRGDPSFPEERRDKYDNLILLCAVHHTLVDNQPNRFTVDELHRMKKEHEAFVRANLLLDDGQQRDDVVYAGYIDEWERLAHLDQWLAWSSHIMSHGQPSMSKSLSDDLRTLRRWLLGRVWPKRYDRLEQALINFFRVLQDFHETFLEHAEETRDGEQLLTRKFYKIDRWDEEAYHRLLDQYEYHVDLIDDLMCELTRSGNLVCDRVREFISPSFRLSEGRLIVQSGPHTDLTFHEFVVQYSGDERDREQPYPGFEEFKVERSQRDRHFGEG